MWLGAAQTLLACLLFSAAGTAQTIRVEAEDARLQGPTLRVVRPAQEASQTPSALAADGSTTASPESRNERSGYSGGGYVTGFVAASDRLVFDVKVPAAGVYDLRIGYASAARKGYTVEVNGLQLSGAFGPSAGRGFAVASAGRVELASGVNAIAIGRGWGYYDIDYIELTPSNEPLPPLKPAPVPSDGLATPAARALLNRLLDVYGHGTMMGVYNDSDARYVSETTGYRPAIMGGDLSSYSPAFVEHEAKAAGDIDRVLARAEDGYAITLSWHWIAPYGLVDAMLPDPKGGPAVDARWYKGFYTNATTFDLAAAMRDPESKEHAALLRDIDAIAVQLKRLDAAGVPVLWRPLHEAEGRWFWWGAKGPEPFVALWRMMYDRLVRVDGVHNLIWVYTSGGDPAWYPGDAYVDVVGIDAYPEDMRDPQTALWETLQQQFAGRKILAISEYGGVPDVERMQRLGADWAYAVSWSGELGPRKNGAAELQRIYGYAGALKMPVPETKQMPAPDAYLPKDEE